MFQGQQSREDATRVNREFTTISKPPVSLKTGTTRLEFAKQYTKKPFGSRKTSPEQMMQRLIVPE